MNSTQALVSAVRTQLLDYQPPSPGTTLRARLGGGTSARCYTVEAPPDAAYPYVVLRIASRPQTPGFGGWRSVAEFEVQVWDRPRTEQWRAEGIADLIEQAALHWAVMGSGLAFSQHVRRVTLPPAPAPMDRELVGITLFLPVVVWPAYLTTLAPQE
jgi:hypothetical protein